MSKLSFVIPCYNSEKTITGVVKEIEELYKDDEYEIILVNDASPDGTWEVICELAEKNKRVRGLNFSKNFGQHSALMAGYKEAVGEYVVSLDDDGQTPVKESISLIEEIEKGFDVVYAEYKEKKHSFWRNIGTKFNNKMCQWLIGKPKKLSITSFFVARKYIIKEISKYDNPFAYVPGLILRSTKNISSVMVEHKERQEGKSGYTLRKLMALWINGFTAFSIKPLRIATVIGVLVATGGIAYLIYTIIHKIIYPQTPMGWTSTVSILLVLGGTILLVLGMIGEYLGRIYLGLNKEPQYIVKDRKN